MVSDSTYILNQKKRHDTKIGELTQLLENVMENEDNKIVIFSEWKKMFELVIRELEKRGIDYVYLNGDLSTKERKRIIHRYHNEKDLKVFLSTDSGGLGLNLQCAYVNINLDLPWNPAKLEQRIARIYRLGQNQHVYIYNFISKSSIEHRIFYLLGFKKSLFSGTLDGEKDTVKLDENNMGSFMETVESLTEAEPEKAHAEDTTKSETRKTLRTTEEEKDDEGHVSANVQSENKVCKVKETGEQPPAKPKQAGQQAVKKRKGFFKRIGSGVKKFLKRFI